MERKSVYNKGRQGQHSRNISSFVLARQHFKKIRFPIMGLFAVLFVFGMAPIVGNEFQTSTLTNGSNVQSVVVESQEFTTLDKLAVSKCANELDEVANALKILNEKLQLIGKTEGELFDGSSLSEKIDLVDKSVKDLYGFVQSCAKR